MSQRFRTAGGRVDRSRTLRFSLDGRHYEGHPGDTLASALLANGVHLVGRSFKYHRPRGVLAAGAEEPNALVRVDRGGGRTDPNLRATQVELFDGLVALSQNRWPSLRLDLTAVNDRLAPLFPAGFYYKTFKRPASWWEKVYEPRIRATAGLGESPTAADPDRYLHRHVHCDVLVVGAGPAGLMAALAAGRSGARVILCDEQAEPGGSLLAESADRVRIAGEAPDAWLAATLGELTALPELRLLPRTTCFGYYNHNYLGLLERLTDHLASPPPDLPRQRLWRVRAKQVVLATGAIERPLVFPENDRPGVMLASAARSYARRWGVLVGREIALVTNNDSAYAAALDLAAAGAHIAAIVDLRPETPGALPALAEQGGLPVLRGHAVTRTLGRHRVAQAHVQRLNGSGVPLPGAIRPIPCDALLMSGGWNPTAHLFSQSRGRLRFDDTLAAFVPDVSVQALRSVGACRGVFSVAGCLGEGAEAGAEAARAAGYAIEPLLVPEVQEAAEAALLPSWLVSGGKAGARAFVDFQNDVTAKDLGLAVREGFRSIEHVKRYTTTGMGTDQGKTSNVNALAIVAGTLGTGIPAVGTTTFRPPYTPVTFGAFAGPSRGDLFDPIRRTPSHGWAEGQGAVFEDVGTWKRARYFARPGEDMRAAVARECRLTRGSVGIFDASTLGKIDIQGPDAAAFLDRIYTNAWQKLAVGRARYGLMLGEDGMVFDDGVTTRMAEHRFHMTTTTGGAPRVLGWLESWLQTEWPELRVYCTSVTEQWAVVALQGPRARELVSAVVESIDLSREAFPHLAVREGTVLGVPCRVFRVSFTGELGFEINVPWSWGAAVWEAVVEAGKKLDAVVYGTEAMHVLRAEKGYIVAGQETDGTVTPLDLGMDWIVSKQKDFLGRRSLSRPDMLRPDRPQLVGLLTKDPRVMLEEGAQVTERPPAHIPAPMIGHVTSSYLSPTLDRSIALALVAGGRARMGQTLCVPMPDRVVEVEVTSAVFLDPKNERLDA
jgi:sarcosine oxidase subunit alpha